MRQPPAVDGSGRDNDFVSSDHSQGKRDESKLSESSGLNHLALRYDSYEMLDLTAPRCMVLVKSTGEAIQVQVQC
jgi:hypothetical protein